HAQLHGHCGVAESDDVDDAVLCARVARGWQSNGRCMSNGGVSRSGAVTDAVQSRSASVAQGSRGDRGVFRGGDDAADVLRLQLRVRGDSRLDEDRTVGTLTSNETACSESGPFLFV